MQVLDQLRLIARTKGEKAQGRKVEVIKALMVKCAGCEAKYIVRSLQVCECQYDLVWYVMYGSSLINGSMILYGAL